MKSRIAHSLPPDKPSADTPCPICSNRKAIECSRGRDRLFGLAQGAFPLFRCISCGCIFQHPFPDRDTLAGFYPQQYWWGEESKNADRWDRLFQKLEKAYREFVVADHVRFLERFGRSHAPEGGKLLDIGCGSGTFLHVAQSRGFTPHGMDSSPQAVKVAHSQYSFDVRRGEIGEGIWAEQRFDFITMFHVLEHLTDPRMGLKYAGKLLQPNGMLIIQVPNVGSIQARVFGRSWYGLDVPRHVINYSPRALGILLQDMGFEYRLMSRFSLRDNPASIASSLVPWLDPIRLKGRRLHPHPIFNGAMEAAYFALFLLALPAAYLESACGAGGTIWACAWRRKP